MADPHDALIAALEAAGLPVQSLSQEERAMLTALTDEEVTRLIALRTRKADEATRLIACGPGGPIGAGLHRESGADQGGRAHHGISGSPAGTGRLGEPRPRPSPSDDGP